MTNIYELNARIGTLRRIKLELEEICDKSDPVQSDAVSLIGIWIEIEQKTRDEMVKALGDWH